MNSEQQLKATLRERLEAKRVDIVIAGKLIQRWSNGEIKRLITFEHDNGNIHPLTTKPPTEPPAFLRERWNPFNSVFVATDTVTKMLPIGIQSDPQKLLQFCVIDNSFSIHIANDLTAETTLRPNFRKSFYRELIRCNKHVRDATLAVYTVFNNFKLLFSQYKKRKNYYQEIDTIIKNKKIVLNITFGGLGDCLNFTSLPRLLKETHDIDFYLSLQSQAVMRHPDIGKLCFETNPYFKGYVDEPAFEAQLFVQDLPFKAIITDRGGTTSAACFEKQFRLVGSGQPEIFYTPKPLPGYEKTLLCDTNWYSGEKWGLYNDPVLLEEELKAWKARGADYTIEYSTTGSQDIFSYLDKIYAAGHFVCYYSGGNALAAALKKPATVIVPENLEGNALAIFFFRNSSITYRRTKSLAAYY